MSSENRKILYAAIIVAVVIIAGVAIWMSQSDREQEDEDPVVSDMMLVMTVGGKRADVDWEDNPSVPVENRNGIAGSRSGKRCSLCFPDNIYKQPYGCKMRLGVQHMSSPVFSTKSLRSEGGNGHLRSLKYPVAQFLIVSAFIMTAFAVMDSSDAASSGDDGNIHWKISGDTLTLSKKNGQESGNMNDYDPSHQRPAWESGDGWSDVTKVVIQDDVTSVGNSAFRKCTSLVSVTIGNSVTSIRDLAFGECEFLESVAIPGSVTSIGDAVFYHCTSIASITVDANNTAYSSEDGVLFNKEKTELIQYPLGNTEESYNVPGTVTSIQVNAFRACTSLKSVAIPDSVVTLKDSAFEECTSLESVTIGNSVKTIGIYVFFYCTSLVSITVDADNTAYSSEDGALFNKAKTELIQYPIGNTRTSYAVPGTVETIGIYAFSDCARLVSVTIGDSVKTIEHSVFHSSTSLKSVTIGDSVETIGDSAFEECTALESVAIGDSVETIGDDAFSGCTSLKSVAIGDSVKTIGDYAFYKCGSIESVTIPSSVTSIGDYGFYKCASVPSVTIPSSVTSIGDYAFEGCTSLVSITVDENNKAYSSEDGVLFDKAKTKLIQYPAGNTRASCAVPGTVKTIGDWAFQYCTPLVAVTLPDSVETIGEHAFYKCDSIASVTLPDSVRSIGDYAFYRCTSLATAIFGTASWNITSIGEYQFSFGTEDKSVSATVYSPSNIADGKLNDYGGSYTSFTYVSLTSVTVTFDANGGSCDTSSMKTGSNGKLASLPAATRDGYTFDGWYTQADGGVKITASYIFTQNTAVYAHWSEIPSSGGWFPVIAAVGAVLAIIAAVGAATYQKKR